LDISGIANYGIIRRVVVNILEIFDRCIPQFSTEDEDSITIITNLSCALVLAITIHPKIIDSANHEKIYTVFSALYRLEHANTFKIVSQSVTSLMLLVNREDTVECSVGCLFVRSFMPMMIAKLSTTSQQLKRHEKISGVIVEDIVNNLALLQSLLTSERMCNFILIY
jgi:hypothetical protein